MIKKLFWGKVFGVGVLFGVLCSVQLHAAQNASKIMWRVHHRPKWRDMHAFMTLEIISPNGNKRIRKMESWSKTDPKTDETKMLILFLEPADIKGTKFLLHEHKNRDDDMWIYIPAIRKAKRIAASGKAGPFMGSDFSNYDIGGGEYEDWSYKLIKEENYDGHPCWVIEATAKNKKVVKKSGYSKMVKWVRKDNYMVVRTDCYDRSGELFKRILTNRMEKIQGIWFETEMTALKLEDNRKSVMRFEKIQVDIGLPDRMFSLRALK